MKRALSLVLSLVIIVTMCAGMGVSAEAASLKAPKSVKTLYVTDYDNALLTWKKVKNADGYIVYSSQKKKKGFKKVTTLKNKNFNRAAVYIKGKGTYFKVAAYKGKKKKYSKVLKVKRAYNVPVPENVTLIHRYDDNEKKPYVEVYNSSSEGSEVYRSEAADGEFVKIGAISRVQSIYSDYNINTEKTYYYKLRNRRKVNGEYKYGEFSEVLSINLKETPVNSWASGGINKEFCEINSVVLSEDKSDYVIDIEEVYPITALFREEGDALLKGMKSEIRFSRWDGRDEVVKFRVKKVKTGENGKRTLVIKKLSHKEVIYDPDIGIKNNKYTDVKDKHSFSIVRESEKEMYMLYDFGKPVIVDSECSRTYPVKADAQVTVNGKTVNAAELESAVKGLNRVKITIKHGFITEINSAE